MMTVFFSDAGCIGLQGFLEDPMWSRASSQDKLQSNMMTDPTTVLVRHLEHRQHSFFRHSNYDAMNPPVGISQLRCSAVQALYRYHQFMLTVSTVVLVVGTVSTVAAQAQAGIKNGPPIGQAGGAIPPTCVTVAAALFPDMEACWLPICLPV